MDYVVHHEPFQYYQSTANPSHLPPTSTSMIGKTDQANHQYDLSVINQLSPSQGCSSFELCLSSLQRFIATSKHFQHCIVLQT